MGTERDDTGNIIGRYPRKSMGVRKLARQKAAYKLLQERPLPTDAAKLVVHNREMERLEISIFGYSLTTGTVNPST